MVDFPVTVDINCNTENKTTRQEGGLVASSNFQSKLYWVHLVSG